MMHAILIIQFTNPSVRAWNYLQTRLKSVEVIRLAECGALQVLSVSFSEQSMVTTILDFLRSDLGDDLKSAYWLESPSIAYRIGGEEVGWIVDYPA